MSIDTSMYRNIQPMKIPSIGEAKERAMTLKGMAMQQQRMQKQGEAEDRDGAVRAYHQRISVLGNALEGLAGLPEQERAAAYPEVRKNLLKSGVIGPEDAPEQYDPTLFRGAYQQWQASREHIDNQLKRAQLAKLQAGEQGDPLDRRLKEAKLAEIESKARAQDEKKAAYADTVTRAGQTVIRDISTAIDNIDKHGRRAAGIGSLLSVIPESKAKELQADIKSIESNVAVDQLLKIKQSGAGLGQVPQSQLEMLASLMGGLRQDMPPEKLKRNLQDIGAIYRDIVEKEGGDPFALARSRGFDPSSIAREDRSGGTAPGMPGASEARAAPPPRPGTEQDGYVYMGGDPSDPKSWKRAR